MEENRQTTASSEASAKPLRCMLQQVAMPQYRLPFYRGLSERPGMDLLVLYGKTNLPNVAAEGIKGEKRTIKRLPGNLKWDGVHLAKIRSGAFDATSMSWNVRFLTLFPGLIAARRRGVGVAVWGHGYSKNEGRVKAWARLQAAKMADAVVTYTHTVAEQLVRQGLPREKIFTAQNCIEQTPVQSQRAAWQGDPGRLDAFRAEQRLEGPVLLFVSRLEPDNRVDLLLDTVASLRETIPGITAVIIGDGPERSRLEAHAAAHDLGDHARFLGAIYEEEQLAPWFCAASLFVYPCNIGLSILHAMGYGLPVVTSDDVESQNPEIEALIPGETGLLYRRGDFGDLVEAVRTILADHDLRQRMSEAAHRSATEQYTITRMIDGMEAGLRYAAAQAAPRRRR